jgi:hypothetical protein
VLPSAWSFTNMPLDKYPSLLWRFVPYWIAMVCWKASKLDASLGKKRIFVRPTFRMRSVRWDMCRFTIVHTLLQIVSRFWWKHSRFPFIAPWKFESVYGIVHTVWTDCHSCLPRLLPSFLMLHSRWTFIIIPVVCVICFDYGLSV